MTNLIAVVSWKRVSILASNGNIEDRQPSPTSFWVCPPNPLPCDLLSLAARVDGASTPIQNPSPPLRQRHDLAPRSRCALLLSACLARDGRRRRCRRSGRLLRHHVDGERRPARRPHPRDGAERRRLPVARPRDGLGAL